MLARQTSYEYEDLLRCGRGELSSLSNAQLPLPPMLMFDRICELCDSGGAYGKGRIVAELRVLDNPALNWIFDSHFADHPEMPGCLQLDALWQLAGFFLGWLGVPGKGRALGVGKVQVTGTVTPATRGVEYVLDV